MYIRQSLERSQAQKLLPRSWDVPPSQYMDVFTNSEALQTPLFRSLYAGFIT